MCRARVMREGALSITAFALIASGARAEASEPVVEFDAPKTCASKDDFVSRVRSRTRSGKLTAKDADAVARLDVKITTRGQRSAAALTVTDARGGTSTRRIAARTCVEAVDGIALVTALTLDPSTPESEAGPGAEATKPTESTESTKAPAADAKEPAPEPAPTLEESPRAADPKSDQFPKLPLTPAKPADKEEVREGLLPSHFAAGFTAMELYGPLPHVIPGLEIGGEGRVEVSRLVDVGFRFGLRIAGGTALDTPQGDATFDWWAIAVGACPGIRSRTDTLSLAACAMYEQGQTHAEGNDTRNPRSSRRGWAALGPALRGRWAIVPRVALEGSVDALLPLARDTFTLGTQEIHEAQAVALRFGAGVAFRFQ